VEGGVVHHVVADQLGTPVAMFRSSGTLAWQFQPDIFGFSVSSEDTSLCPFRWPGQSEDTDTGLYYNRFRFYDPQLGAYLGSDPIGIAGGLVSHGYVPDPLGWVDPFGLADCRSGDDGNTIFHRYGDDPETATRLARLAAIAERAEVGKLKLKGLHGVSVSPTVPSVPSSRATRTAIENAGFKLVFSPTDDPHHHTLILPKPVTREVADAFNALFGRKP
jgi:RHS repeat-associated protein